VLLAAEQLQLAPAQLLMVGDDVRDLEAGQAAGCCTAAVAWGYGEADQIGNEVADYIFLNISDMCDFIKQIIGTDSGALMAETRHRSKLSSPCR